MLSHLPLFVLDVRISQLAAVPRMHSDMVGVLIEAVAVEEGAIFVVAVIWERLELLQVADEAGNATRAWRA